MNVSRTINNALRMVPAWSLYIMGVLPPVWLFYLGLTGGLGVDPIKAMEHEIGKLGLQVLVFGLAITPLRKLTGLNLMKFRRALGLIGFFYIALHLLVWLVLDVQILGQIWADIIKRPYITVGMAALIAMIPLAVTSNNWSIRKLGGASWKKLHKVVYGAVLLGGVHYTMVGKVWQSEALMYLAVITTLLAMRLPLAKWRLKAAKAP